MKRLLVTLSLIALNSACGTHDETGSTLNYITWGRSTVLSSTIADATKDRIEVCLTGNVGQADYERSKEWSVHSTLAWLRVLKKMDERVTSEVVLSCDDPDLTFRLLPGNNRSNASARYVNIYMARPYGEWTHELGHALAALGDTYQGSTAGNCQRGHAQSLMCWGAYGPRRDPAVWSTLWPDDIAGIRENYFKIHDANTLVAPDFADEIDPEVAFEMDQPWPAPEEKAQIRFIDDDVQIARGEGPTAIDYAGLVNGI